MTPNPVIELLAKQSTSRLRDMDKQIGEQIEDLRVQHDWVLRALAEKGVSATPAPAPSVSNGNGERPKRKRSNKRQAITQVLLTDPGRVWLPSEVRDALLAQGVDSTAAAVRVTLRRMGDDGELERPSDGNGWKLADPNLAPDPSSSEESDALTLRGEGPPL